MMKAVQHCQPSFPANALWPQTNLQPGIIHVSHSLIAGTTFKSASLIRSWTTGDTCIHFANKSPPPSFIWYLHSCTALWTLEENGSSSTSTLRPTDSTGESSLLSFFLSFFKMLLHSSSPKFRLLGSAEAVVRVPRDWASNIDGSERGASPTGDAAGIQHSFSAAWCSQSEINLLLQNTLCIQSLTACRIHSSHTPCSCQAHE